MRALLVLAALAFVAYATIEEDTLTCKFDSTLFTDLTGGVTYVGPSQLEWGFGGSKLASGFCRWHIHMYHMNAYNANGTAGAHYNVSGDSLGELSMFYGNIPQTNSVSYGYNCTAPVTFPTIPSRPIVGRSIVLHTATARPSCCTIGFYASNAGAVPRCEFNQLDTHLSGYIEFTGTGITYNITGKDATYASAPIPWHIHTFQAYPWNNCTTTMGHYNPNNSTYGELATLCGNITAIGNGATVTGNCPTTNYASVLSTTQIGGRSTMLHYNTEVPPSAGCSIGYYVGTTINLPCPTTAAPTTSAPGTTAAPGTTTVPTTKTSGVAALSASFVVLVFALIAMLF